MTGTLLSYRDMLNADGSMNRSAFEGIVAARTEHEINLALCVDNGLKAPLHIGLGQIAAWRAAQVALQHLDTIPDRQRAEIENGARDEALDWFHVIRNGAFSRGEIAAPRAA